MIEIFAYIACAVLASLAIFQLALIVGAPLGKYAWGGTHTVLPAKLRISSIASTILYCIFALIILSRTGLVDIVDASISHVGIWVLTVYFFIGVVMNGISRSKHERAVMTPVALVLALLCLAIAVS